MEFYAKERAPYVYGVQEHGDRECWNLSLEQMNELEGLIPDIPWAENPSLNRFEDGLVCLISNEYNARTEDYEEQIVYEFSGKEVSALNEAGWLE